MKKLTIPLVVYLFCFINQANAQTFTNYPVSSTSTNLCYNEVTSIAIDKEGNKWFGTNIGVSKFNDTIWTTYTTADGLTSNSIGKITIDNEDNIWFGTDYGPKRLFIQVKNKLSIISCVCLTSIRKIHIFRLLLLLPENPSW